MFPSRFPSALKMAKVVPIFKTGDGCLPRNYRPIAILPVISKMFQKGLVPGDQFGFKPGRSAIESIVQLIQLVTECLEDRQQ